MKSIHLIIFYCFSIFFLRSQENINNDIEFNGFFDFKYEEKSNKIFLEVDKLNYDFLYIHSLTTGLGSNDIGLDRGQLGDQKIVRFKKYGNKLLLIQPNQKYRAYTDNILEKKSALSVPNKAELLTSTINIKVSSLSSSKTLTNGSL